MAAYGFQAIAVDLPGHGRSFPIEWEPIDDLHEYAEWVMEFARTLGLEKPVIAGCSIGANITIDIAAHHSADVSACIAFEGAAYTPTFVGAGTFMDPHTISWESISGTMAPTVIRPDATPEQRSEIAFLHTATSQRNYAGDLVGWENYDVRDRLDDVTVPLMIGLGSGDYFLPEALVTATVDAIPTAELVHFENLGHYPIWENPELVNEAIVRFLRDNHALPDEAAGS
jgi:pimeloyl-ACP methyl ester carboxylesterase